MHTTTDSYQLGDGRVVTVEMDIEKGVDANGWETSTLDAVRYAVDGVPVEDRDEITALITEARRAGATPA